MALFASAMLAEHRPPGEYEMEPCPVCGKPWRPAAFSRLTCHAKCLWTDTGALFIYEEQATPAVLARRLGVTEYIVKAGIRKGRRLTYSIVGNLSDNHERKRACTRAP